MITIDRNSQFGPKLLAFRNIPGFLRTWRAKSVPLFARVYRRGIRTADVRIPSPSPAMTTVGAGSALLFMKASRPPQ